MLEHIIYSSIATAPSSIISSNTQVTVFQVLSQRDKGYSKTWINNFLTGRTEQVIGDGCSSDDTLLTSGVLQGTVPAPSL